MNRNHQRGAAMLVLLTMLVALAATSAVTLLQRSARGGSALVEESRSLALAAEALRGRAFLQRCQLPALPVDALLPCPEIGGTEGHAAAACPGKTRGWLPWRTLGLPPLRDASGTCLWIEREGTTARIIAAGPASTAQNRTPLPGRPECGGNSSAANYLDASDHSLPLTLDVAAMAAHCP